MLSLTERVDACIAARKRAANLTAQALSKTIPKNETSLHDTLLKVLAEQPELHPSGWYDPPPGGISVLFGKSTDMHRLDFDSIRKEEFWPQASYKYGPETVGFIYLSPVDRSSGMIGDYGFTFYRGTNRRIRNLLRKALEITEDVAEYASVGMQLKGICEFTEKQLTKHGLQQGRMLLMNDPTGLNFGHTVPWSYEHPTPKEQAAITNAAMPELKNAISRRRLYINRQETFALPETCAFTIEPRVVAMHNGRPELFYFHIIVTFREGKKYVAANFNTLFEALGMDYIRSRFDG
jgi:hypothetical protein